MSVRRETVCLSVCLSYSSQSLLVLAGNSFRVVSARNVAAYLRKLRKDLPCKVGTNVCRDQLMSLTFLRKYEAPHPTPRRTHLSGYKFMLILFSGLGGGMADGMC